MTWEMGDKHFKEDKRKLQNSIYNIISFVC